MTPQTGKGRFQWNTGGWFGSQVGATAYLVLLGGVLAFQAPRAGLLLLFCGLLPNLLGTLLWLRRDRLAPYPALQGLLAIVFAFTAIALGGLVWGGPVLGLDPRFSAETRQAGWILLLFPGLMAMFHLQEKGAPRQTGTREDTEPGGPPHAG